MVNKYNYKISLKKNEEEMEKMKKENEDNLKNKKEKMEKKNEDNLKNKRKKWRRNKKKKWKKCEKKTKIK